MKRFVTSLVTLSTLLLLSAGLAAQEQPCYTYRTILLESPYGSDGTALRGINREGTVLANATNHFPSNTALVARQGRTKLRITYIFPSGGYSNPIAKALNQWRDMAGTTLHWDTQTWVGFFRKAGSNTRFQEIQVPGGVYTDIHGMNSKRDLVGAFHRLDEVAPDGTLGPMYGFWRYKGQYLQIHAPVDGALSTVLTGINTQQDVVGWYTDATGAHGLHLIDNLSVTFDVPGAAQTYLEGLNDLGAIVGRYTRPDDPPSNDHARTGRAFVYHHTGVFVDLVPAAPELMTASGAEDINSGGEIVGWYLDLAGRSHGFIATPTACANTVAQR